MFHTLQMILLQEALKTVAALLLVGDHGIEACE